MVREVDKMDNFIPYIKLSKKERQKFNTSKRSNWNGINPVTKVIPDKKHETDKQKCKQHSHKSYDEER